MVHLIAIPAVFVAGVVVDRVFAARVIAKAKVEMAAAQNERDILKAAAKKAEGKL